MARVRRTPLPLTGEQQSSTRTELTSGGREYRRTVTTLGGASTLEVNGRLEERSYQLCEDSAQIDRWNRITYINRESTGALHRVLQPGGRTIHVENQLSSWPELAGLYTDSTQPWGVTAVVQPGGERREYTRDAFGQLTGMIEGAGTPGGSALVLPIRC